MLKWWMRSWWHRLEVHVRVPRFLKGCPQPFRGEVLEVGAGPGWTTRRIMETFPQVELTATDIDPRATAEFTALEQTYGQRLRTQSANVLALPFDRESFDFVLAINILNFLSVEQVPLAIAQLLRVLRPGGLLGIARCGLVVPQVIKKEMLEQVLGEEKCDIVTSKGGATYYLWARKSYPVEGGVVV